MTIAAFEVIFLFSTTTITIAGVALVTVLLTLLRRQRAQREHIQMMKPVSVRDTKEHKRVTFDDAQPVRVYAAPLPAEWRLPIREGTPDQVVISIEPDPGPTLRQSAVQRLIAHLKHQPSVKVG